MLSIGRSHLTFLPIVRFVGAVWEAKLESEKALLFAEPNPTHRALPQGQSMAASEQIINSVGTAEIVQPPSVTEHTTKLLGESTRGDG